MKITTTFLVLLGLSFHTIGQEIRAYYTKIERGEKWEELSRTMGHTDVVVEVGNGQLVFWRGTSYLPVWETDQSEWPVDEIVERSGDGPSERPDATNSFSFVRIISSNDNEAVIHWRYLPQFERGNPKKGVNHLRFVDEYFTVRSNGHVTRKFKQGTDKVEDWLEDRNLIIHEFDLTARGIENKQVTKTVTDWKTNLNISRVKSDVQQDLVAKFTFDRAEGNHVIESVSGQFQEIAGHQTYWKAGISGSALGFDGYVSKVEMPIEETLSGSFTVESWVALGAYPFNWAPIIHQSKYGEKGFYLGVGPSGQLKLSIQANKWVEVVTKEALPIFKWTHIVATYNGSRIKIFIDGKPVRSKKVRGMFQASDQPLVIGLNTHEQVPGDPVRPDCDECHTPAIFGFDGLIDELSLIKKAITSEEVERRYQSSNISENLKKEPDLNSRQLPLGPTTGQFKAHYTRLKYYDTWDNLQRFGDHSDVVVEFEDLPTKFIFWRGMSYVPQVANAENQWYNNQFNESWDEGGSWGEPMSDKQSVRSHVRIIEDHSARKVIHWRYAQVQIDGTQQNYDEKSGWGDWSDWYYYIYPDGVASKRMIHWSWDDPLYHEWQESIGVMSPGQTPESLSDVHGETVYLDDMRSGNSYNWSKLSREENIPIQLEKDWEGRPLNIQVINYNSEFDPFTIGDFEGAECYGDADGKIAPYSQMVVYIHWPLGQLPTDGTRALQPDRGSSNGYTHLMFAGSHDSGEHWAERTLLEGMSDKSATELRPLAKSWLNAPLIANLQGVRTATYDKPQRAYVFEGYQDANEISFTLDANEESPVENACFVIKNWGDDNVSTVKVDKQIHTDFRQGNIIDTNGTRTLILYLKYSGSNQVDIQLSK